MRRIMDYDWFMVALLRDYGVISRLIFLGVAILTAPYFFFFAEFTNGIIGMVNSF